MAKPRATESERRLLKLAGAVSDRAPVDWDSALARDPALEQTIARLKALQAMAAVHETASNTSAAVPGAAAAASPGLTHWGSLQILESLGRGGFGHVYRAFESGLDREVALKLWRRRDGEAEATRQIAEARTLARLRHPNLPVVFGVAEHEGWLGMWTELIRGRTVEEMIAAQGPLGAREAALIGVEICRALAAVHAAGLVHRDVKTSNVMREESGRVVLVDFGLAVRADSLLEPLAAGTPPCMAPETLRGERATAASDLYSLGVLLYRLVTAAYPYEGATAQEIADAHARGARITLAERRAELPAGFVRVLERALEPTAAARHESAEELEHALAEFLQSSAVGRLRPGAAEERSTLPQPLTHFVGRREELAECLEAMRSFRLVTLLGPGGSGKTRLAIRAAEAVAGEPQARVAFVDLSPLTHPDAVAAETRRALGVAGQRRPLAEALGSAPGLLVLDNCEHVLEGAAAMAVELLSAAPRWQALATSRSPLKVPGESVVEVPPLALPPAGANATPAALRGFDAMRLFVERARLVRPDFRLTDDNAAAVADICRRADGLPLAIELAAARVRALTPMEILDRLPDALRLLDRGSFSSSAHHQTMEAAIRWSYDSLTESEQRWMDSLAVFAGAWTLPAAARVCLDGADELQALDAVTGLIERSLVTTAPPCLGVSRYRFLEILRAFALTRLRESGRFEELEQRHAQYFVQLAEGAEPHLWGPDQAAWAVRLEADHPNFLAALAWMRDRPECAVDHLRLAGALSRFWMMRAHLSLGRQALEHALAGGSAADPAARARALLGSGALAIYQSDHAVARARCAEAIELYRAIGDDSGVARTLVILGVVAHDALDYSGALGHYSQALALFRRLGDTRGIGHILNNMGALRMRQEDWSEARRLLEEALPHVEAAKDPGTLVLLLTNLGFVSLRQGMDHEAGSSLIRALEGAREHGLMRHAAAILETAGALLAARHESAIAARLYAAAEQQRLALGAPPEPAWRKSHEPFLAALARDLGAERLAAEQEAGGRLDAHRAIEEARRALDM